MPPKQAVSLLWPKKQQCFLVSCRLCAPAAPDHVTYRYVIDTITHAFPPPSQTRTTCDCIFLTPPTQRDTVLKRSTLELTGYCMTRTQRLGGVGGRSAINCYWMLTCVETRFTVLLLPTNSYTHDNTKRDKRRG